MVKLTCPWSPLLLCVVAACAGSPSPSDKEVRATRYRIDVARSGLDRIHGVVVPVDEIFFPDYGIACDVNWDVESRPLRVFPATVARLEGARDVTHVGVPGDLALRIIMVAEQQGLLGKQVIDCGLLPGAPAR